jgi:hypothetical protein
MRNLFTSFLISLVLLSNAYAETEQEYINSTKHISSNRGTNDIYYKEFLKNPDKFLKTKVNIIGKILAIEESEGITFIQIYISRNFDSIAIYYPGTLEAYEDDFIQVYGECLGRLTTENRFGAEISMPVIGARYIKLKNKGR